MELVLVNQFSHCTQKNLIYGHQSCNVGSCTITAEGLATYLMTWQRGTHMVVVVPSQLAVVFTGHHKKISYF
jgi:hypothetical protein